jgi:hypothetical protein
VPLYRDKEDQNESCNRRSSDRWRSGCRDGANLKHRFGATRAPSASSWSLAPSATLIALSKSTRSTLIISLSSLFSFISSRNAASAVLALSVWYLRRMSSALLMPITNAVRRCEELQVSAQPWTVLALKRISIIAPERVASPRNSNIFHRQGSTGPGRGGTVTAKISE